MNLGRHFFYKEEAVGSSKKKPSIKYGEEEVDEEFVCWALAVFLKHYYY